MRLYKKVKLCYIEAAAIALAVCAFLFPSIQLFKHTGDNFFAVQLNGIPVGNLGSTEQLDELLTKARRQVVQEIGNDELVFIDADITTEGSEKLWGVVDDDQTVIDNMVEVMKNSTRKTLHRSYTVKVNETAVNLGSYDEVHELLEQALSPYDAQISIKYNLSWTKTVR